MAEKRFTVRIYSRIDGKPTGEILLETDSWGEAFKCMHEYNNDLWMPYGRSWDGYHSRDGVLFGGEGYIDGRYGRFADFLLIDYTKHNRLNSNN